MGADLGIRDAGTDSGPPDLGTDFGPWSVCGDGIREGAEACDDGNVVPGDGCDVACAREDGFLCFGAVPSTCIAICGDGRVVTGEACDDGNAVGGDGCDDACAVEFGFLCADVPSVCVTVDVCGDGRVATAESCDDGNVAAGDGCDGSCAVEPGYACPGGATCAPICGDGVVLASEACDDGNVVGADGCDGTCMVENGYACPLGTSCAPICGDGLLRGSEACDDGFLSLAGASGAGGDGCSAACTIETGFVCTGAPSACAFDVQSAASVAIADNASVTLTVTVPASCSVAVLDRVSVTLSHSWIGDVTVVVESPDARAVPLFVRPGQPATATGNSADLVGAYVFRDGATPIPEAGAVPAGTYSPTADGGAATTFSTFTGAPAGGTWTLRIRDDAANDVGSASAFGLSFHCRPN